MEKYTVPNKLPAKKVSILARRRTRITKEKNLAKLREDTRRKILRKKRRAFKKPEAFIMEYIKAERDEKRIERRLLHSKRFEVNVPQSSVLLIVRHRTRKIASKHVDKVMGQLHLKAQHAAVLAKPTARVAAMLSIIEPYVTWGTPNIHTVRDLIFKKGKLMINGRLETIQSNAMIEEAFGDLGIICTEDIVHELFTGGENFDKINEKLKPFNMNAPRDGWKKKLVVSYAKGGEYGDRGNAIDELIDRCM
ncbi:large ribosomal subunit protein uL30 [Phlebotomus argentipes]|uniref:large ribosomal subunit protein uL30 n=1 Tax=Phlebotomus argentipes TaxID=94469 RepID=UPI0028935407|nr:large ribosomal subunit protein uL30 [Phlebotomus argentipes]